MPLGTQKKHLISVNLTRNKVCFYAEHEQLPPEPQPLPQDESTKNALPAGTFTESETDFAIIELTSSNRN